MASEFLAQVPLFSELSPEDLDRLCASVEAVLLPRGATLFEEGAPGDKAYVIESGELEVVKRSGRRDVLLAVRRSGEVIGEMSLLEESPRIATVRARTEARLLAIEQRHLDDLIRTSGSAARTMFYTVLSRWRATTVLLQQSERMAQLGTLTAGVAHELNNPAAAVERGADQLARALDGHLRAAVEARCALADPATSGAFEERLEEARIRATRPPMLDALARADREAAAEDWLDDHDLADAVDPGALVDLDLDPTRLDALLGEFGPSTPIVLRALAATLGTHALLAEIRMGAERIGSIVGALKRYSYLDQAPTQEVDVHEGIDNTLLILRSKLKRGISVRCRYDPALPRIVAHGSELNQVWTNLIDNAADALEDLAPGEGVITLRTCHDGEWVMVEVEDNGPGIPPEIQGRIFDAFFTTKPPGKGSGQGLAIASRIVTVGHHGSIQVLSEPGATVFRVVLPIDGTHARAAPTAIAAGGANDDDERAILEHARRVAVVGISTNPTRAAHTVPAYLQSKGYTIVPVNPNATEVLAERAYPDLFSAEGPIDTVLVFRPSEDVPALVKAAVALGVKHLWLQPGTVHQAAVDEARRAGLVVVSDTCIRQAHKRWERERGGR